MVANVVGLARSNPALVATVEQWDADPFGSGAETRQDHAMTIDLRSGAQRDPIRATTSPRWSRSRPRPPGTPAPLWTAFLDRITGGNVELQAYLQRVAGYCLTGSVKEHVLFFLYGTGANGKSVFVNTLVGIWDDYAVTISTDMLMVSQTDRHPTEIARLRGARLVVGSEVETGRTWAESKIKSLTGGDRLQGRFMRQDFFEFDPQFKLMVVGNNKPSLRGVDEAIRRRLHLIPFTVTIPPAERDPELPEKLKAEWPAILRWAIDGCLAWQREGLNPPPAVRDATATISRPRTPSSAGATSAPQPTSTPGKAAPTCGRRGRAWAEAAASTSASSGSSPTSSRTTDSCPERQGTAETRGYRGARLNRPDYTEDPRYGSSAGGRSGRMPLFPTYVCARAHTPRKPLFNTAYMGGCVRSVRSAPLAQKQTGG